MEEAKRNGLMVQFLLEFFKEESKYKENSLGLMVICIKAISKIIKLVVLVNLLGMMEDIIKVNGKTIKCMEKAFFVGSMGKFLKVTINMTKKMVKVSFN